MTAKPLPASIDATVNLLADADYLADRSLGTVLYLALKMGRPIFLEGEAGVGKTEIAKVLSSTPSQAWCLKSRRHFAIKAAEHRT